MRRVVRALFHAAFFAGREEFVARVPRRQVRRIGHIDADKDSHAREFLDTRHVPIVTVLVGWLMVALFIPLVEQFLAGARRLPHQIAPLFDRERRYPDAREREMIRPIITARLRARVRRDGEAEAARGFLHGGVSGGSLSAE